MFLNPSIFPRVLGFCWLARKEKFVTVNKLRRQRNHFIVNGCPRCSRDEETVHNLFIHCKFALSVWMALFS